MRYLAGFTILLLLGCVQVPKQEPYQLFDKRMASQHKLQSADHWAKLSDKLVTEWGPLVREAGAPLFIEDRDISPFGRAMTTFLATDFFNTGAKLSAVETPLQITWEVQSVYHKADRRNSPGLMGILLLDIPQVIFVGELDVGNKPHTEVIITFNLINNNLLYGRKTAIFYINAVDVGHYPSGMRYTNVPPMPVFYNVVNR